LRLSNLQLMPTNLQLQYCYLLSVTSSIINPSALFYERKDSSIVIEDLSALIVDLITAN
jgi:hypothetical protein